MKRVPCPSRHTQLHALPTCAGGMQAAGGTAANASWMQMPHLHLRALMKLCALFSVSSSLRCYSTCSAASSLLVRISAL
jgi:hypothetical protein